MLIKRFMLLFSGFLALALGFGAPAGQAEERTNSIGMEFVLIQAGSFTMGADKNFETADDDETPQHEVTINEPFYLGKYEVTQEQWVKIMGENPSKFKARNNPVEEISWADTQIFINKLNEKEGTDKYRLPTEAEWEYAARAGTNTIYSFGDDPRQLEEYAWYKDNADGATHPVGQLRPNAWGLYDMHGNVWEWVQDWYQDNYYSSSPAADPPGPSSGSSLVLRGGSWNLGPWISRSANRYDLAPDYRQNHLGLRLAFSAGQ
jgi:formylglycine-generating enzyme required for sulfatase activity